MSDVGRGGAAERPYPFAPLALAAGVVGAAIALFVTRDPYGNPDSHAFEAIARSVLAGRGLTYVEPLMPGQTLFAYRAPVYPLFLAPLLALGGVPLALAAQGALAGVTAALVGGVAARLADRRAGLVAFACSLAWLPAWWMAGNLLSETLFVFLFVLLVATTLRAGGGDARFAAIAGAIGAAAALTRSIGAVVLVAVGGWLLFRRPRLALVMGLAAVIVWAPWPIRNAARLHAFVPLTTNGAGNFFDGNSPVTTQEIWREMAARPGLGELGWERHFAARTRAELLPHPVALARTIASKAVHDVVPFERDASAWPHCTLWLLALAGLALFPAVRSALALPGLAWIAHTAVCALTMSNARFRFPGDWVIVLAAALAWRAMVGRWGVAKATAAAAGAGALATASLLAQALQG